MSRDIDKQIEKLNQKILEARSKGQFIKELNLSKDLDHLLELREEPTRTTLREAIANQPREKRMELTSQVIIAVSIADMLVSATMDVESKFRQFGINGVPMMEELRDITKRLSKVVSTIDIPGINILSETYCDVADRVEEKVMGTLKEYTYEEMGKVLRIINDRE